MHALTATGGNGTAAYTAAGAKPSLLQKGAAATFLSVLAANGGQAVPGAKVVPSLGDAVQAKPVIGMAPAVSATVSPAVPAGTDETGEGAADSGVAVAPVPGLEADAPVAVDGQLSIPAVAVAAHQPAVPDAGLVPAGAEISIEGASVPGAKVPGGTPSAPVPASPSASLGAVPTAKGPGEPAVQAAPVAGGPAEAPEIQAKPSTAMGGDLQPVLKGEPAAQLSRVAEAAAPPARPVHGQVAEAVVRASSAPGGKVTVQLAPNELGRVEVTLTKGDGHHAARIVVDRPETLDVIRADIRSLERSLAEAGMDIRSGAVSVSLREGRTDQQGETLREGERNAASDGNGAAFEGPKPADAVQRRLSEGRGMRLNISV